MQKKKGCGCCLWGCLGLGVIAIMMVVGGYFGVRYIGGWVMSDNAVVWVYQNYARTEIRKKLPPDWSEAQKDRVMNQADVSLKEYLALPPDQKKVIKQEAIIAMEYYSKGQVIPYDKIPNLKAFVEKQINAFQGLPAGSPRLLQ